MAPDSPTSSDLKRLFGDLAVDLHDQSDAEATLREFVRSTVGVVPGAHWGGISLIEGRTVQARVPTDQIVAELDTVQLELGEGPGLSALREAHTVRIDDMSSESRWPHYARAAAERGVF